MDWGGPNGQRDHTPYRLALHGQLELNDSKVLKVGTRERLSPGLLLSAYSRALQSCMADAFFRSLVEGHPRITEYTDTSNWPRATSWCVEV
jgi:hypothetical protein